MQRQDTGDQGATDQPRRVPPASYLLLHPTAKLTAEEKQQLLDGLLKTAGVAGQQVGSSITGELDLVVVGRLRHDKILILYVD